MVLSEKFKSARVQECKSSRVQEFLSAKVESRHGARNGAPLFELLDS
jgi:hypothetical protein